jgi:hypothetical protein
MIIILFLLIPYIICDLCKIKKEEGNKIIFNFEDAIRLQIFTSSSNHVTLEIKSCNSKILNLNNYCKQDSQIKLITHGFMERWRMDTRWDWVEDMKNEFFNSTERHKLCVIAVDWKELATGGLIPNYWKAISNMKIAGELAAVVLNNSKINIKNVHCIGFSLGGKFT